ncbi:MAG TPA: LysE family transporter [Anaeromyxobacteraceae bacterium]|nr:LysE family transporter [Anaeromyxobacteraceae bacterium]
MNGSFLAGLGLQASLIVAIGPQNAFVLRQGLRREHVWPVVALCTAADVLLVVAGVAGVSAAVQQRRWALLAVTWAGAAALAFYGVRALRRAARPGALAAAGGEPLSPRQALAQAASFTFLNPHVYLDAFLLVGVQAVAQPAGGTPWFLAGASAASAAWFGGLGLAAHLLAPLLARSAAWRLLDLATGLTMCAFAARLAAWGA